MVQINPLVLQTSKQEQKIEYLSYHIWTSNYNEVALIRCKLNCNKITQEEVKLDNSTQS